MYWFVRGGVLVLTGMPRLILGESCTTSIQDFAIFPPHKKKKKSNFILSQALAYFLCMCRLYLFKCLFFLIQAHFLGKAFLAFSNLYINQVPSSQIKLNLVAAIGNAGTTQGNPVFWVRFVDFCLFYVLVPKSPVMIHYFVVPR